MATQQCNHTLRHHTGKVQAVAWNPAEAPVLLTGGYDKQACLVSRAHPPRRRSARPRPGTSRWPL